MLATFRNLSGFRGEASLSTWLFQIARSFCIKARRGVHPTTPIDPSMEEVQGDSGQRRACAGACRRSQRNPCNARTLIQRESFSRGLALNSHVQTHRML
jgi:DNA-directed RNA polymerase specialized sigma24 family protein